MITRILIIVLLSALPACQPKPQIVFQYENCPRTMGGVNQPQVKTLVFYDDSTCITTWTVTGNDSVEVDNQHYGSYQIQQNTIYITYFRRRSNLENPEKDLEKYKWEEIDELFIHTYKYYRGRQDTITFENDSRVNVNYGFQQPCMRRVN